MRFIEEKSNLDGLNDLKSLKKKCQEVLFRELVALLPMERSYELMLILHWLSTIPDDM